jgi:hypothetical protein
MERVPVFEFPSCRPWDIKWRISGFCGNNLSSSLSRIGEKISNSHRHTIHPSLCSNSPPSSL